MNAATVGCVLFALAFGMGKAKGEEGLGVGVIAGEPTGISIKKWIDHTKAVDAAAAWSLLENGSFQFHADYLIHSFTLLEPKKQKGRSPVCVGVGGRVKLGHDEASVGIRIPFGISYLFAEAPVDIFAEVVPIFDLVPETGFDVSCGIGARYYFR